MSLGVHDFCCRALTYIIGNLRDSSFAIVILENRVFTEESRNGRSNEHVRRKRVLLPR